MTAVCYPTCCGHVTNLRENMAVSPRPTMAEAEHAAIWLYWKTVSDFAHVPPSGWPCLDQRRPRL